MADLRDVIDKLTNEGELVRNKGAHSIKSIKEIILSNQETPAQKKQGREDQRNFQKSLLSKMAGSAGAGGGGAPAASKEGKKIGGLFGGIGRAIGSLGRGVGKGIGGFMKGLSSVGTAAKFMIAFPMFGFGIAGFALALGGAAWAISKLMPSIAEGLTKFEDINGSNLIDVGKGMIALGGGFAAMGAGKAISGVGNLIGGIADGVGGLFGMKSGQEDLMEKLKKFSKVKLDGKSIKENAEAMTAYGIAMTTGSAGSMLGTMATLADGAIGGLAKLIGGVPVVDQLIAFSKHDIDVGKVKNNALAMRAYAGAMLAGAGATGMEALASLGNVVTNITDGLVRAFGGTGTVDKQIEGLQKLSAATGIDPAKVKNVAKAMVFYAGAMIAGAPASLAQGVASLGNIVSNVTDGLVNAFGGDDTITKQLVGMKKMTDASDGIDATKVANVATAMMSYAKAMASGAKGTTAKAWGSIGNFVGGIADSLSGLLGGKKSDPIGDLKKFALQSITPAEVLQIQSNTKGLQAYAEATKIMAGIKIEEGKKIGGWFSDDKDPMSALDKFASKSFDTVKIKNNVAALQEFANFKYDRRSGGFISFAKDLAMSVPAIETAIMGGKINTPGWGGTKIEGLGSPDIKYEQAVSNISKLRASLGMETAAPTPTDNLKGGSTTQDKLLNSIEALTAAISASAGGANVVTSEVHNAMGSVPVVPTQPIKHMIANGSGGPPR